MPQEARLGARAERRRSEILGAAEQLFAEKGFDATRLEDVAEAVGIRRASLVYYFKDKSELYDAVLDEVFGGLLAMVAEALGSDAPLGERIESGVSSWVDYVGNRPTFARILLREVANATPAKTPALARHQAPFIDLIKREVFDRGIRAGELGNAGIDPVHISSTIAGATVFYVAAMPSLVPDRGAGLLTPEQLDVHREQVLRIVRRLIGTRGPRRARS